MNLILWSFIGFSFCIRVFGQVVPFTFTGALDSATADSSAFNSGGKISVNGVVITVPRNLQVQFPAAFIPFVQVTSGSYTSNEVTVTGNYVNGVAIAGLISLAQFNAEFNTGIIESVNFIDGSVKIAGGPVVRINDPNGVYSKGYTLNPFFTADDVNPSITAFSGFPMCIPRSSSDPKCPSSNRPAGVNSFQAPDPLTMAPFIAGDYIEYSGIKVGGEIVCYSIVAPSVQITTTGVPAYIRVEDAIIGVFDGTASEFAETRFIGYVSDPSVSLLISAIDVDPCTGQTTDRTVGSATPRPVAVDARGKWLWRADSTTLSKYTREYHITTSTGTRLTNNGILAGQYVQPVGDWVFPEPLGPGVVPFPNDFSQFTHLANGIGPDASGNVFGQLTPWPGANAPTPAKTCPAQVQPPSSNATPASATSTPIANAGPDVQTRPGVIVTLSGKNDNSASAASDLTFAWTQTAGPAITLTGADTATASFTAPPTASLAAYTFLLVVRSASAGTSANDTMLVTSDPAGKDDVVIDSYTWSSLQSGTISVTAHTNVADGTAKLSVSLNNPTPGAAIQMTSQGGGKFSYNARSTKKPTNGVTVASNFGGSNAKTATSAKRKRADFVEAMTKRKSEGWGFDRRG